MVRIRTQPKSMHLCLQRRGNQKRSTFRLAFSWRKILISTSTTWRSSTACRQTCLSWRRKPERSFCRVWKRAGTTHRCENGEHFLGLYGSFHGGPESGHNYQRHRGGRQGHSSSEELGDLHDQNNRVLETCKGCGTKAGSAGGRLDVIRDWVVIRFRRRVKLDCFETSCVTSVNTWYLSYAALFSTLQSMFVATEWFGQNCKNATKSCLTEEVVVERQYRRSVSCNAIAWADCLVTGGVSGQYSRTCSSLVFLFCINYIIFSNVSDYCFFSQLISIRYMETCFVTTCFLTDYEEILNDNQFVGWTFVNRESMKCGFWWSSWWAWDDILQCFDFHLSILSVNTLLCCCWVILCWLSEIDDVFQPHVKISYHMVESTHPESLSLWCVEIFWCYHRCSCWWLLHIHNFHSTHVKIFFHFQCDFNDRKPGNAEESS